MSGIKTRKEYFVHSYEVDYKYNLLPTALISYFQDIAMRQGNELGIGGEYLSKNSLSWILIKYEIDIYKYPQFGEKIHITTIPTCLDKFYAFRKFEVVDAQGNEIATAKSQWMLINSDTLKLTRIPQEIYLGYNVNIEYKEHLKFSKINNIIKNEFVKEFYVRYSDIDFNRHVNNTKYIAWVIETIPIDEILNYQLCKINIIYKKAAKYGDKVKINTDLIIKEDCLIGIHKVSNENGQVLCTIETKWQKK